MSKAMHESESESVKNAANSAPDLMTLSDRFHGAALQTATIFIEHLFKFELSSRDVFLIRHVFTFLNYFAAGIFFYLILLRRFGNTFIPLLGILLYILYPRFFGESFYNIKDIMFFSWYVISAYFALRWLEDGRNTFLLPAASSFAIAANTRILGISVLLLACVFSVAIDMRKKLNFWQAIQKPLLLMALTFICYVIITPLTWENPLKNTIDTFVEFMDYKWIGTHLYMGEMITRHVPWHYIPVWMGLTIPLFYIVMFFVGASRKPTHLFDAFFATLFFCTLLGFISLQIGMYDGWRHAYGIYASFLYVVVLGLERSFAFLQNKRIVLRRGFACVVAASMVYLFAWIVVNHPYQYIYFNIVGRQFAEKNFALDYWDVSFTDLIRKVLANDDRPKIKVTVGGLWVKDAMLTDDERKRVTVLKRMARADYYFKDSRPYKLEAHHPGFAELYAITVDGMKISAMLKRVEPSGYFDDNAWSKIERFESNVDNDFDDMHDEDPETEWSTNRPQQPGDYMMFEFGEYVSYNHLQLDLSDYVSGDYPRDLRIYVSADGNAWQTVSTSVIAQVYYKFETEPYRFLKLENKASNDRYSWSVSEMKFGYTNHSIIP
jgi:hypothetical protein